MFWKNVRDLLNRTGRDLRWLRKQLGVPSGTMSTWTAKDRIPKAVECLKISQLLDTTMEYLMTGENLDPFDTLDSLSRQLCAAVMELDEKKKGELMGQVKMMQTENGDIEREPSEAGAR